MFKHILIIIFFVSISNSKAEIKEKIIENLQNIENLKFNNDTPFVFNSERSSVFLKKDGSKDYLRATYFYTDYKIVLK